jgi:hypothetical protein
MAVQLYEEPINIYDFKSLGRFNYIDPDETMINKVVIRYPYIFIIYQDTWELFCYHLEEKVYYGIEFDGTIDYIDINEDASIALVGFYDRFIIYDLINDEIINQISCNNDNGDILILKILKFVNNKIFCYFSDNFFDAYIGSYAYLYDLQGNVIKQRKGILIDEIIISNEEDIMIGTHDSIFELTQNLSMIKYYAPKKLNKRPFINKAVCTFGENIIILAKTKKYKDKCYLLKTTINKITRQKSFVKMIVGDYTTNMNIKDIIFSPDKKYFFVFFQVAKFVSIYNTHTMELVSNIVIPYLGSLKDIIITPNYEIMAFSIEHYFKCHTPLSIIEYIKENTNVLPNEMWNIVLKFL